MKKISKVGFQISAYDKNLLHEV